MEQSGDLIEHLFSRSLKVVKIVQWLLFAFLWSEIRGRY